MPGHAIFPMLFLSGGVTNPFVYVQCCGLYLKGEGSIGLRVMGDGVCCCQGGCFGGLCAMHGSL